MARPRIYNKGCTCNVDGCENQAKVRGMCVRHYHRMCRNGDPVKPTDFELRPRVCTVKGCDNPAESKGLCEMHAIRLRRNGTLTSLGSSDGNSKRLYIPGIVDAPSVRAGCKELGITHGKIVSKAKKEGVSPEKVIVRRFIKKAELLLRKIDTAQKQLNAIDQEKEREKKKANFEIWGEFSCIALCPHCGRYYNFKSLLPIPYVENRQQSINNKNLCSEKCKEERKIISKEKQKHYRNKRKKKLKEEGKYDRGKHRRRALKVGSPWTHGITAYAVAKRDNMICAICGCEVEPHYGQGWQPKGWTVGHIVPLSDPNGPGHVWSNVQCECHECNTYRGTMTVSEFLQKRKQTASNGADNNKGANTQGVDFETLRKSW